MSLNLLADEYPELCQLTIGFMKYDTRFILQFVSKKYLALVSNCSDKDHLRKKSICRSAAKNNYMSVIQWTKLNNFYCDEIAMASAVMHGHIDMIIWLEKYNGCKSGPHYLLELASRFADVPTLQHLLLKRWIANTPQHIDLKIIFQEAVRYGNTEVIEWVYESYKDDRDLNLSKEMSHMSIEWKKVRINNNDGSSDGNSSALDLLKLLRCLGYNYQDDLHRADMGRILTMEIVQWMLENNLRWISFEALIKYNKVDILKYVMTHPEVVIQYDPFYNKSANAFLGVRYSHIEILEYLKENGANFPSECYGYCLYNNKNSLPVMEWLFTNGCKLDPSMKITNIGMREKTNYYSAVRWLHDHGINVYNKLNVYQLIEHADIEFVKWYFSITQNGPVLFKVHHVTHAAQHNKFETMKYLVEILGHDDRTLNFGAATSGNLEMCKYLVYDYGKVYFTRDFFRYAALNGHIDLVKFAYEVNPDIYDIDPELTESMFQSALQEAVNPMCIITWLRRHGFVMKEIHNYTAASFNFRSVCKWLEKKKIDIDVYSRHILNTPSPTDINLVNVIPELRYSV